MQTAQVATVRPRASAHEARTDTELMALISAHDQVFDVPGATFRKQRALILSAGQVIDNCRMSLCGFVVAHIGHIWGFRLR